MGGRASVQSIIAEQAQKTREEVIRSVLPIYYTTDELTTKEKTLLYESFHFIMKGKAENFRESYHDDKKCPAYHFGTLFFGRLFETNTAVKGLFVRDMHKMSHSLIDIFTLLIDDIAGPVEPVVEDEKDNVEELENTNITNNNRWKKTLEILVKSHNAKGIRAIEYGVFGEIFFWTIKTVCGEDHYTHATHIAYIKFYSKLLSVIIPLVVDYELANRASFNSHSIKRRGLIAPPSLSFHGLNTGRINFKNDEEQSVSLTVRREYKEDEESTIHQNYNNRDNNSNTHNNNDKNDKSLEGPSLVSVVNVQPEKGDGNPH